MKYIQFYTMSTGYVPGSIPPKFEDNLKVPQEAVGIEGVHILDGRLNYAHCKLEADSLMTSPRHHRKVGYRIMQGPTFTDAKPIGPYVSR